MRVGAARGTVVVGGALLWVVALGGYASAQGSGDAPGDDDQIVLHGQLLVPEGETVGAAVIFDGPAIVEGTVSDALVVFNGNVEISGLVRDDVVVFNGDVVVRSGAEIGGNLVSQGEVSVDEGATIAGEQRSLSADVDMADVGLASRFAWWLAYSLSTLALGLILLAFAPKLDDAIWYVAQERKGPSIVVGLAFFFLLPVVAVMLLATIVGIPLGLFLLLALALLYTVGYVAGAHALGRMVVKPPKSRYVAFLAGWAIVRALALVPFVGGLVWTITAIIGLGVLAVAARQRSQAPTSLVDPMTPPMPAATR
jgi:hypothetical protein